MLESPQPLSVVMMLTPEEQQQQHNNINNETMINTRQSPLSPPPPPSLVSSSLPTRHPGRRHSLRRRHPANDRGLLFSASIPLPQTHIHRTPSELQLADDIIRAEYEDVRMCVRLVSGMRSRCLVSGFVHPRTMQSLQDILKTKYANENQLEHTSEGEEDDDCGWGFAYEEEEVDEISAEAQKLCDPVGMMSSTRTARRESSGSENLEEDECVFSLEL